MPAKQEYASQEVPQQREDPSLKQRIVPYLFGKTGYEVRTYKSILTYLTNNNILNAGRERKKAARRLTNYLLAPAPLNRKNH